MDIRTAFPSKYLKAADLQGEAVKVKIRDVTMEDLGDDRKPVAYFENKEKGLVLNKTNGEAIAADCGWNTDTWIGVVIEIFPAKTQFNGSMVDTLRVRVPRQKPGSASVAPNARARAEAEYNPPAPAPPAERGGSFNEELDDDIPFAPEWRG